MTISQSTLSQCSKPDPIPFLTRVVQAIGCWHRRRKAEAELRRLMQVGDYLLRDVGLDPKQTRLDLSAATEQFMRRN
jgi:uncharacterized protein YjiS (DUF1127 family)